MFKIKNGQQASMFDYLKKFDYVGTSLYAGGLLVFHDGLELGRHCISLGILVGHRHDRSGSRSACRIRSLGVFCRSERTARANAYLHQVFLVS
jgi:hypothetical protein